MVPTVEVNVPAATCSGGPGFDPVSLDTLYTVEFPNTPVEREFPPVTTTGADNVEDLSLLCPSFTTVPVAAKVEATTIPIFSEVPLVGPAVAVVTVVDILSILTGFMAVPPVLFTVPISGGTPPAVGVTAGEVALLSVGPTGTIFASGAPIAAEPVRAVVSIAPDNVFSGAGVVATGEEGEEIVISKLVYFPPFLYFYFSFASWLFRVFFDCCFDFTLDGFQPFQLPLYCNYVVRGAVRGMRSRGGVMLWRGAVRAFGARWFECEEFLRVGLARLRCFYITTECRGVAHTSGRLFIARPSMSGTVGTLRRRFNVGLFCEGGGGLALAPRKRGFCRDTRRLLTRTSTIESRLRRLQGRVAPVHVKVPPVLKAVCLPSVCLSLGRRFPSISLQLCRCKSVGTYRLILRRGLSLTVIGTRRSTVSGYGLRIVSGRRLLFYMSGRRPLTRRSALLLGVLASRPLILFGASSIRIVALAHRFGTTKMGPRIMLGADRVAALVGVMGTSGVNYFLCGSVMSVCPSLIKVPIFPTVRRHVNIV